MMEMFLEYSCVSSGKPDLEKLYLTLEQAELILTTLGVPEKSVQDLTREPSLLLCTRRDGEPIVSWADLGSYLSLAHIVPQHERLLRKRKRELGGA